VPTHAMKETAVAVSVRAGVGSTVWSSAKPIPWASAPSASTPTDMRVSRGWESARPAAAPTPASRYSAAIRWWSNATMTVSPAGLPGAPPTGGPGGKSLGMCAAER
jgi:hypothetical protein